jgi:hypothetical protein
MRDNLQLVEYAKQALNEKWGYVWGTFGQVLTPELLKRKNMQYPGIGYYLEFIKQHWMGKKVADCVGLIKGFYWSESGELRYDANTDISADGMYERATKKGPISTMPEIPGICLHSGGHIGIYIGNGRVIEAHGTKYGVIETPLKGAGATSWVHWLYCPYIIYLEIETPPIAPKAQIGTNAKVLLFQKACNFMGIRDEHGKALDEDGILGTNTRYAMGRKEALIRRGMCNPLVGVIQKCLGITVDDVYGNIPFHETYDAIGKFQAAHELEKDYIVWTKTWTELLK